MTARRQPKAARRTVPLDELKPAPYNPPRRTLPKNLKTLVDSLDLVGLLAPVTVGADLQIIDGHRRVAAAKLLGWAEIECNVVDLEPTAVYASVNVSSRSMGGNDALAVWLSCPTAAPARLVPRLNRMADALGLPLVRRMADAGLSLRVFQTARRIGRYCDDASDETVARITEWLITFPIIGQVMKAMKAMEAGVSPRKIMDAVKRGKPVKLSLDVA